MPERATQGHERVEREVSSGRSTGDACLWKDQTEQGGGAKDL
jgi:hypothetical protein